MESRDQSKKVFLKIRKTIAFKVKNTDTIDAVKSKVQEMEGLALSQQELFFAGTALQGAETLDYYNVPTNACIDLYFKDEISISIKTLTKSFSLNVKKSDSVSDIKAMIEDKEGIPIDKQILIFSHKVLDEDEVLSSCGIGNNAVLYLLTRPSCTLHVTVKSLRGSTINLKVHSWYTIAELKLIIGLPQDYPFKIFCSNKELKDDKTLHDYKIKDNAVLEVVQTLIQVFVRTFDGKSIAMVVDKYEKASDVVDRIGKKLNLSPSLFGVRYMGRRLISESTLHENGIVNDTTLHVMLNRSTALS